MQILIPVDIQAEYNISVNSLCNSGNKIIRIGHNSTTICYIIEQNDETILDVYTTANIVSIHFPDFDTAANYVNKNILKIIDLINISNKNISNTFKNSQLLICP